MRVLDLTALPGRRVDSHGSKGFSVSAFGLTADAHLVTITLAPGGVVGRHPAAGRQLLVVLAGDAVVSGSDGDPVEVRPGQAVVWEPHEPHETRTTDGLTALVLEGEVEVGAPGHHVDPGDV